VGVSGRRGSFSGEQPYQNILTGDGGFQHGAGEHEDVVAAALTNCHCRPAQGVLRPMDRPAARVAWHGLGLHDQMADRWR